MTIYVHRTLIVPSTLVDLARNLAATLAGSPAVGMWITGLSPTGVSPATHFVSSGPVAAEFAPLLTDADALWSAVQMAQQAGVTLPADAPAVTHQRCVDLVTSADISGHQVETEEGMMIETPFQAFNRLGLSIVVSQD